MPMIVGSAANATSATPLSAMPVVTARSSRAPKAFWISPGDTTNAGPRKKSRRQPDCGEPPAKRSMRAGSAAIASQPPASAIAIGATIANPTSLTASCTQIHVGGAEQAAGDEVDADERRAEQRIP